MQKIDMHFHTTFSDWEKSNKEVLEMINPKEIDFLVVAEHDIINKEFKKILDSLWISTSYAAEISACDYTDNKSMHILHYSNEINIALEQNLESIRNARLEKIKLQIQKLKENWFNVDYKNMLAYNQGKWLNIENLMAYNWADFIYQNTDNHKIITEISGEDNLSLKKFYNSFMKRWWEFDHIWHIDIGNYEFDTKNFANITDQNSILSIAHVNETFKKEIKTFSKIEIDAFAERIDRLVKFWLNAIEVNPMATKKWLELITYFRNKHDLILTFWSDCHFWEELDWKHWELFQLNEWLDKKIVKENIYRIKDKLGINWVTNERYKLNK